MHRDCTSTLFSHHAQVGTDEKQPWFTHPLCYHGIYHYEPFCSYPPSFFVFLKLSFSFSIIFVLLAPFSIHPSINQRVSYFSLVLDTIFNYLTFVCGFVLWMESCFAIDWRCSLPCYLNMEWYLLLHNCTTRIFVSLPYCTIHTAAVFSQIL